MKLNILDPRPMGHASRDGVLKLVISKICFITCRVYCNCMWNSISCCSSARYKGPCRLCSFSFAIRKQPRAVIAYIRYT